MVVVCDAHAAEFSKMFSEARKYSDYCMMLDTEAGKIDAAVVAMPCPTYIPAGIMAMRMSKHVYCETSLGQNITEIRLATEVAKETGIVTLMGNSAHNGYNYLCIAKMVRDGVIGDVKNLKITNNPDVERLIRVMNTAKAVRFSKEFEYEV